MEIKRENIGALESLLRAFPKARWFELEGHEISRLEQSRSHLVLFLKEMREAVKEQDMKTESEMMEKLGTKPPENPIEPDEK